jgi:predicted GIY-YIG superfamily endonuclease
MTTNIYIIKLNQNKYYIGHAINLEQRLNDHADGKISKYTQKYKPLNIKKIIPDANPKYLDKYVIKYMEKYGMNSVRGGSFDNEILGKEQIKYLKSVGIKEEKQNLREEKQNLREEKQNLKEEKSSRQPAPSRSSKFEYEEPILSLQEQQLLEQQKYKEELMEQPKHIVQRRRPEGSLVFLISISAWLFVSVDKMISKMLKAIKP